MFVGVMSGKLPSFASIAILSSMIPFGLCNAPATSQHFINNVFHDLLDNYVIAYLDDILVYLTMQEEHAVCVWEILSCHHHHCLYAKLEKCAFLQQHMLPQWCMACSAFWALLIFISGLFGILLKRLIYLQH